MKFSLGNLIVLSAAFVLASCNSNKTESSTANPQTAVERSTSDSIIPNDKVADEKTKTIEGIVKEIAFGKDGYTATIETNEKLIYQATISRVNLTNPKQYRDFNKNEIVKLKGDVWKMENENQLTVRAIE